MEILFKDYYIYRIKLLHILLASALQSECTSVLNNQTVEQFELCALIGYHRWPEVKCHRTYCSTCNSEYRSLSTDTIETFGGYMCCRRK